MQKYATSMLKRERESKAVPSTLTSRIMNKNSFFGAHALRCCIHVDMGVDRRAIHHVHTLPYATATNSEKPFAFSIRVKIGQQKLESVNIYIFHRIFMYIYIVYCILSIAWQISWHFQLRILFLFAEHGQ